MVVLDGKKYFTLPERLEKIMKDSEEINKKILNGLMPFIEGVVAFISDENVDCLSKVQLCNKIGEPLRKIMEKGE